MLGFTKVYLIADSLIPYTSPEPRKPYGIGDQRDPMLQCKLQDLRNFDHSMCCKMEFPLKNTVIFGAQTHSLCYKREACVSPKLIFRFYYGVN